MKLYKLAVDSIQGKAISSEIDYVNGVISIKSNNLERTIDLQDLVGRPDFSDYCVFSVSLDNVLINLFAHTLASRQSIKDYFVSINKSSILHIVFPSASNLDLAYLVVNCGAEDTVAFNGFEDGGVIQSVKEFLPTLFISEQSRANGVIEFQIQSSINENATLYVTSTAGVLLNPQVNLVAGIGKAYVSTAGLPSAISGKLKAGFKYYSNIASIEYLS